MPKDYAGRDMMRRTPKAPIEPTQGEGSLSDGDANSTASQKGTVAATEEDGEDAESDSHPMPAVRRRTVPQVVADRSAGSLAKRLLEKALWYASVGAKIIPLAPGSKKPLTKHGLKDASDDPEQIEEWWRKWPTANIGIRTGRESGIIVIDVDVKNGAKGMESLAKLEEEYGPFVTLRAKTPTGGNHIFFLAPDCRVPNRTNLLPGIDVRGDDGYIVVAPSVVDGNSYDWEDEDADIAELSEALLEFLTSKGGKRIPARAAAGKGKEHTAKKGLGKALSGVAEGGRNDHVFRLACRLRRENMSYEEVESLVLTAAANCTPPLEEDEALRCLESAWSYDSEDDQDDPVSALNMLHSIIQVGGKTYVATEKRDPSTGKFDVHLGTKEDLKLLYENWRILVDDKKTVSAADIWLRSPDRRQYKGIGFFPGGEVPGWFNLWRGFSVKSAPGNCSKFWQHLFSVICQRNMEHYRYLRRWLAHMIQKPKQLPEVAIVIIGLQGTGKGIFLNMLRALIRQHYLVLNNMSQLTGQFNWHLKDVLLAYANEAVWAGDRGGEGALKMLVTDSIIPVMGKFLNLVNIRNCMRLIVTTNKAWAVPMEPDDRRFLILKASDHRKGDRAYFRAMLRQMYREGGLQALLHDLQREDLRGFDVRTKPESPHAIDIKLRSADAVVQWWHQCLTEGDLGIPSEPGNARTAWDTTPSRQALHGSYLQFCETHRLRTLSRELFGRELRKMLPPGGLGETRPSIAGQSGRRLRPHCYVLPSLDDCRQAFEQFFRSGVETWG